MLVGLPPTTATLQPPLPPPTLPSSVRCSIAHQFHAFLGDAIKLKAAPFSVRRHSKPTRHIAVEYTAAYGRKVSTTCRRLIVAAGQDLPNLETFIKDLDKEEKAL